MRAWAVIVLGVVAGCNGHLGAIRSANDPGPQPQPPAGPLPTWWCESGGNVYLTCSILTELSMDAKTVGEMLAEQFRFGAASAKGLGHDTFDFTTRSSMSPEEHGGQLYSRSIVSTYSPAPNGYDTAKTVATLGPPDDGARARSAAQYFAAVSDYERQVDAYHEAQARADEKDARRRAALAAALSSIGRGLQQPASSPPSVMSAAPAASDSGCYSDVSCGVGMKCVRNGYGSGVCAKLVDEYGMRSYDPGAKAATCEYGDLCPVGFTCDHKIKACVKR